MFGLGKWELMAQSRVKRTHPLIRHFHGSYNEVKTRWINIAAGGAFYVISLSEHNSGGAWSTWKAAPASSRVVSTFHWVHCPFGVTSNENHKESNSICVMSWEPSANYKAATFLPHYARRWDASEMCPLCLVPATISQMQITETLLVHVFVR